MPMSYADSAISDAEVPRALQPVFQHLLDTYASETSKVLSVWRQFSDEDLSYRPHVRSSSVLDILKHQLLSERRLRRVPGSTRALCLRGIVPTGQRESLLGPPS
jgi:hypothetical protein